MDDWSGQCESLRRGLTTLQDYKLVARCSIYL